LIEPLAYAKDCKSTAQCVQGAYFIEKQKPKADKALGFQIVNCFYLQLKLVAEERLELPTRGL
jgi:hypothetical protein